MHPRLLHAFPRSTCSGRTSGPFTLHTYGVLLAIAFLAGLWVVSRQARREGLDAGTRHRHGRVGAHRRAARARSCCSSPSTGATSPGSRARSLSIFQSGGRLLRRAVGGLLVAWLVRAPLQLPRLAHRRRPGARGHHRPGDRAAGLLLRRLLLGQAHAGPLGGDLHRRVRRPHGRHADGRALPPEPALRVGRRLPHLLLPRSGSPRASASTARSPSPTSRSTRPSASPSSSGAATPTAAPGSAG